TLPISAPTSAMAILLACSNASWLPPAATYRDFHGLLHHVQRAIVHLDDRPDIGALRQTDVGRNGGLPSLGRQGELGIERAAVVVCNDVNALHVVLGGHGQVSLHRHRHDRSVLGNERRFQLDLAVSRSDRAIPEQAVDGLLHFLVRLWHPELGWLRCNPHEAPEAEGNRHARRPDHPPRSEQVSPRHVCPTPRALHRLPPYLRSAALPSPA